MTTDQESTARTLPSISYFGALLLTDTDRVELLHTPIEFTFTRCILALILPSISLVLDHLRA